MHQPFESNSFCFWLHKLNFRTSASRIQASRNCHLFICVVLCYVLLDVAQTAVSRLSNSLTLF